MKFTNKIQLKKEIKYFTDDQKLFVYIINNKKVDLRKVEKYFL